MKRETYANVWDALEDSPEAAANMTVRSTLLTALQQHIKSWAITQGEAAKRLHITQPRLNDLLRGRINNFSIDALINLMHLAGLTIRVEIAAAA